MITSFVRFFFRALWAKIMVNPEATRFDQSGGSMFWPVGRLTSDHILSLDLELEFDQLGGSNYFQIQI